MRNPFFTPSCIGLDVQPSGLRLVQLRKNKRGFRLERIAMQRFPADVVCAGKIKRWDLLSTILSDFIAALGLKGMAAAIHLYAHQVRMQCMQLPEGLTDREIQSEIITHVERDLPGTRENFLTDFCVLRKKIAGYEEVHFTLARQAYLTQWVDCVNASGLCVKVVDVDVYALKRAILFGVADAFSNNINAILHQTTDGVTFILFDAQQIIFHHHWHSAPSDLLSQLKNKMQICLATLQDVEIHRLILFDEKIEIGAALGLQVISSDLMARLQIDGQVDLEFFATNAADFLLALGLAMVNKPRW